MKVAHHVLKMKSFILFFVMLKYYVNDKVTHSQLKKRLYHLVFEIISGTASKRSPASP